MIDNHLLRLAKDPSTTSDKLIPLLGQDVTLDRLLAKHLNSTDEMLTSLALNGDKLTQKYVAQNPNSSLTVLSTLASSHVAAIFDNPSFEKKLGDNPNILDIKGRKKLNELIGKADINQPMINWVARHGTNLEKVKLWDNCFVPIETFIGMPPEYSVKPQFQSLLSALRFREEIFMGKFLASLGLDVKPNPSKYHRSAYLIRFGRSDYETVRYVDFLTGAGRKSLFSTWKKLVPKFGDANTVQGQFGRVYYLMTEQYFRFGFNNWPENENVGKLRYLRMIEFLQRMLVAEKPFGQYATQILDEVLTSYLNLEGHTFESNLKYVEAAIYAYCEKYVELIPYGDVKRRVL